MRLSLIGFIGILLTLSAPTSSSTAELQTIINRATLLASGQEEFSRWAQNSCKELYAEKKPEEQIYPCERPLKEYVARSQQMFGGPSIPRLGETYGAYFNRVLTGIEAMHTYTEGFIAVLRTSSAFDARFGEDLVAPYTEEDIVQLRSAVRVFEQRTDSLMAVEGGSRISSGGRLSASYNVPGVSVSPRQSDLAVLMVAVFILLMWFIGKMFSLQELSPQ